MDIKWMGRYRSLIRALVYYSNSSNKTTGLKAAQLSSAISQTEYQILEHICEFEDEIKIMADISRELGILPSIVTKCTAHLTELGYIEKFRIEGNRKSIVLRPTDAGRAMYTETMERISPAFDKFFEILEDATEEELQLFERSIRSLGNDWATISESSIKSLHKIEQ